jgi:hypothetical protein
MSLVVQCCHVRFIQLPPLVRIPPWAAASVARIWPEKENADSARVPSRRLRCSGGPLRPLETDICEIEVEVRLAA